MAEVSVALLSLAYQMQAGGHVSCGIGLITPLYVAWNRRRVGAAVTSFA